MRKHIFFAAGLIIAVATLHWIDSYTSLETEGRPRFIDFVQSDIVEQWSRGQAGIKALPQVAVQLVKGRQSLNEVLTSQIQKSLEVYYLTHDEYPPDLSEIIDLNKVSGELKFEYVTRGAGYVLYVRDAAGKLLQKLESIE